MTTNDLLQALVRLRVETGSLACLGCGHEHNCSTRGCAILRAAADLIERLTAENAKAEAERDALIEQIKERHDCLDCKHNDSCEYDGAIVVECINCVQEGCPCAGCCDSSHWEWRGLPDALEEGEKA